MIEVIDNKEVVNIKELLKVKDFQIRLLRESVEFLKEELINKKNEINNLSEQLALHEDYKSDSSEAVKKWNNIYLSLHKKLSENNSDVYKQEIEQLQLTIGKKNVQLKFWKNRAVEVEIKLNQEVENKDKYSHTKRAQVQKYELIEKGKIMDVQMYLDCIEYETTRRRNADNENKKLKVLLKNNGIDYKLYISEE